MGESFTRWASRPLAEGSNPVTTLLNFSSLEILAPAGDTSGTARCPTSSTALKSAGETEADVVGYVFAINGKLNSAEIYPSNGLFRKMWPKLVKASITEAIGQKDADREATPASDAAQAFLTETMKGEASEKPLTSGLRLETRAADKAFYFETRRADGAFVHRSYLAK